jgi:hypothetical protein
VYIALRCLVHSHWWGLLISLNGIGL